MATSGYVDSSKGLDSYFRVSWSRSSYSTSANTSTINWTLYLYAENGWGSNSIGIDSVYINGTLVKSAETYSNKSYGTYNLASGTTTIKHNNDGTKSFTISLSGWFYEEGSVSGSKTFTLDSIPRYATCSQSVDSKTETTIVMDWSSDSTIDRVWYSKDNGANWLLVGSANASSGSYSITGLTAGTSYNIKTRVRRKDSQLTTDSSKLAVTTYSYPHFTDTPSFTIGDRLVMKLYNPLGRSVAVSLIMDDDTEYAVDTYTGTQVSGFVVQSWQNRFYQSIPNKKSGIYKAKAVWSGHTNTKTGGSYTVPDSSAPTIGSVSYYDGNASVVAITGDNQKVIPGKSRLTVTATNIQTKNYATISNVKVSTVNMTVSGTTATASNLSNAGAKSLTITVTDSRGLKGTKTLSLDVVDYTSPSVSATAKRQSGFYTPTEINVTSSYTLIGTNAVTIELKARVVGTTPYTITQTVTDGTTTINLDNQSAWEILLTITDSFGSSSTFSLTVNKGIPLLYFDTDKDSVSVNKFPTHNESFEVGGSVYADGQMTIEGHSSPIGTVVSDTDVEAGSIASGGSLKDTDANVTLTAGVWVIDYSARFPANATGYRGIRLKEGTNGLTRSDIFCQASNSSTVTSRLAGSVTVSIQSSTRYEVQVMQGSGSSMSGIVANIVATRLA